MWLKAGQSLPTHPKLFFPAQRVRKEKRSQIGWKPAQSSNTVWTPKRNVVFFIKNFKH